jgi:single-stranded DNA-binding protein
MRTLTVTGNLVADAEMKVNTNTGEVFFPFTIGSNEYVGKDGNGNKVKDKMYFDAITNNEAVAKCLTKGALIALSGSFRATLYTDKKGNKGIRYKIDHATISLLDSKSEPEAESDVQQEWIEDLQPFSDEVRNRDNLRY